MEPINNWYSWTKHMRKKRRWSSRRPVVVGLVGAELVRAKPSEIPAPEQAPEEETPKSKRSRHVPE